MRQRGQCLTSTYPTLLGTAVLTAAAHVSFARTAHCRSRLCPLLHPLTHTHTHTHAAEQRAADIRGQKTRHCGGEKGKGEVVQGNRNTGERNTEVVCGLHKSCSGHRRRRIRRGSSLGSCLLACRHCCHSVSPLPPPSQSSFFSFFFLLFI